MTDTHDLASRVAQGELPGPSFKIPHGSHVVIYVEGGEVGRRDQVASSLATLGYGVVVLVDDALAAHFACECSFGALPYAERSGVIDALKVLEAHTTDAANVTLRTSANSVFAMFHTYLPALRASGWIVPTTGEPLPLNDPLREIDRIVAVMPGFAHQHVPKSADDPWRIQAQELAIVGATTTRKTLNAQSRAWRKVMRERKEAARLVALEKRREATKAKREAKLQGVTRV